MPTELVIEVAGIRIKLSIQESHAYNNTQLSRDYAAFVVRPNGREPIISVRIEQGEQFLSYKPGPIRIDTWREAHLMRFISYRECGWYDFSSQQGELLMRPGGYPENFLRALYAWLGVEHGSLLLHSSGVVHKGRGYVFFGASGSGKTTITRLSVGDFILSDDLVMLRRQPGTPSSVAVYGTPFRGDFAEAPRLNTSAKLCGLYALVKDQVHELRPINREQAAAMLAACVPFVMSRPDSAGRVLELCQRIVDAQPVQALHFRRDPGFWSVIDG